MLECLVCEQMYSRVVNHLNSNDILVNNSLV